MFVKLNAPLSEQRDSIDDINRIRDIQRNQKLNLSDEKFSKLQEIVNKRYNEWDSGTSSLRENLKELNKFFEGKEDPTDFPFGTEDSSQIDLRLAAAYFRSLRTLFRRSVFGNRTLVVVNSKSSENKERAVNVESAINWNISNDCNLVDVLKDTDLQCYRDGLSLVYGEWVREIETGVEFKIYDSTQQDKFTEDYPDEESAGVSKEKYDDMISVFTKPDADNELRVQYQIDFIKKDNIEYTLFPFANFIFYPFFVKRISDMDMYGFIFKESNQSYKKKVRDKFYDDDKKVLDKKNQTTASNSDKFSESRDEIEGISTSNDDYVQLAKINVKADLDNDNIIEKYTIIYNITSKKIIRVERYPIRLNTPNIVPFRFIDRDGRFIGASLLEDSSDTLKEINALHRHRSNVRRLTDSPILQASETTKTTIFDNYIMKPGNPMFIPAKDFASDRVPKQLILQNLDRTSTSIDEEVLLQKDLETLLGPTQGLSGQVDPSDPRAPGNKTAMLLTQANARVQDYIDEWGRSMPAMMNLHVSLIYQNSKNKLGFIDIKNGSEEFRELDITDLIGRDINYKLTSNTVSLSPEIEMQRIQTIAVSGLQWGGIQSNPQALLALWNSFVVASRIPGYEKFMHNQPIPQEMVSQIQNRLIEDNQGKQSNAN
jgi:hypothetical protein